MSVRQSTPWAIFILGLVAICLAETASGAIVLLKSGQQLKGFLIRQNATEVVVSVPLSDGRREEKRFSRAEVDDVIITVVPDRLAKLDPARPTDYRDYAEELAEKREDPEARETALRLYLLAAALDEGNLGRSSLLAMASLGRSPAEAKSFRAMSFLLDPAHNRRLLEAPGAGPVAAPAGGNAAAREFLIKALRSFRQGKMPEAIGYLKRPGVAAEFEALSQDYPYDDFLKVCQGGTKNFIPPSVLVRTLEMEISLGEPPGGTAPIAAAKPPADPARASWSAAIVAGQLAPVRSLRLESITEWNPRENRYRDGKWVAE